MFGLFGPRTRTIDMTPAEVKAGLDAGELVLIDVREPDEHRAERIQGARNMPLSRFDPKALPVDKTVVLHCAGGVRSARAVALCKQHEVDVRRHLAGGLAAWKAHGLPTRH